MARTVHVIGAGVAGLSAAVRVAGAGIRTIVYEAAAQAGGRCRSFFDPILKMTIDNGNHLLLSANHAAFSYLSAIGALDQLAGPPHAEFAFVDLANRERWVLRINDGRLPWWVFQKDRRVPGTATGDYLAFLRLLCAPRGKTICETVRCDGPLYARLARPLWLAALNTEPQFASARLAAAITRETLGKGGKACRPLIARDGLGAAFIDPALHFLATRAMPVEFGNRLRRLEFSQDRVVALDFGDTSVTVGAHDSVVLAVPPAVARDLLGQVVVPSEYRAIINAHFRITPPPGLASLIGVVNGTIEWLFAFKERLSVTISCADRLLEVPREALARQIWQDVAIVAGISAAMPPWQIVRERRATFAATPDQDAKRPGARTAWRNLFLAGDWTDTGLPATIEGAVRSGHRAADLIQSSYVRD